MSRRFRARRISVADLIGTTILAIGVVPIVLPFLWIVSTALKNQADAFALPPLILFEPYLKNFAVLTSGQFLHFEFNSILITGLSTGVALLLGVPAGWALARGEGSQVRLLGAWMLATYMIPGVAYIVPLYLIFTKFGLTNTYLGLVLGYQTGLLPFTAWMMRSYFLDVPSELEDAARVDGCSRLQAFRRVILPVSITGVSTVGLLVAVFSWGEYFGTLILGGTDTYTAPIGIATFVGSYGASYGQMAVGTLFVLVPIVFVTVIAQRGLIRGLTGAAVKG